MSGASQILSRKISGAHDLQGVVRSMKALAASSIEQYEQAVTALDDYFHTVQLGLHVCLRQSVQAPILPADRRRAQSAIGAIVFGSDQGLVGRFNEILWAFALPSLRALPGAQRRIWAVGERMQALVRDESTPAPGLLPVPASVDAIAPLVGQILIEIQAARARGEISELLLFHNHPQSAAVYQPVCRRLLPLDRLWQRELEALVWPSRNLPQLLEGETPALPALIGEYLFVLLFQACAESLASENASRLASMQRAERNIEDMLEDLGRRYHRQRQESIDEELFEVISGYEALSRHRPHGAGSNGRESGNENQLP